MIVVLSSPVCAEDASSDKRACNSIEGQWEQHGTITICNRPTKDAGKPCVDGRDCESACVTYEDQAANSKVRGKCYSRTSTLGTCLNYVVDGVAQGVQCED